jgi:predicted phage terminase large subunit-like protein
MFYVNHVNHLDQHSTWRRYERGLRELILLEAPAHIVREYKYKASRDCFLAFADLMLDNKLKVAPFHEIIASNFEAVARGDCKRLIISCPPRSGKSMLSQIFVAWLLGRDEQTQHIIASYGAQLSGRFHRGIVAYLKHKAFSRVFPEWSGFEADSKYDMKGGGYILATSVGGVLTGFTAGSKAEDSPGVGAIVIDDPLKSSDSKAALTGLESWWGEQASTRRTNRFAQVLIGTRFHERDLHGVLMDSDGLWDEEENPMGWRWVNIPGVCENEAIDPLGRKNGESHWPDNSIFSPDMLKSQKRAMGSTAFAALYQGTPTAAEGAIIKPGWLNRLIDDEIPTEFDITYMALDTAFSEKEAADESVICVAGFIKNDPENIYIRELITGRWAFPDLIAMVEQTQKYYGAKFMCIEQAASGQSLIQVLERETKIHIHKFKPLKSKTIRLQTVAPLFEAGRVKFIDGEYTESFFKELTAFPHTPHDDRTDATVWALTYFQHHMDARGAEYANAFGRVGSGAGRTAMFGEFTELKRDNNRSRGRRSMFGAGSAGEQYRLGAEGKTRRSDDLRYDTGM